MSEEATTEQVLAFARTLRGKSVPEAVGQLMLAFQDMDLASARAAVELTHLETPWPHADSAASLVTNTLSKLPSRFCLRGFPGDVFRGSAAHSYINDAGDVTVYLERLSSQRETYWLTHSKGSLTEVQAQIDVTATDKLLAK